MTFKTRAEWELDGLINMFSPKGERNYPFFEAGLFGNYFIIDARQSNKEDDFEMGRRFFISSLIDAIQMIIKFEKTDITHKNIILLQGDNYSDTGDYVCSIINEIIHCKDEAGQDAWVYSLKNGKRIVDSLIANKEGDLNYINSIYNEKKLTNYGKLFFDANDLTIS